MGETNEEGDEQIESLIVEARRHYLDDFPNPERVGCPPQSELRRVAESREIPDADFRDHLLHCSPCFREFRELRESHSDS
jgi:hypothetical protein